MSNKQLARGIFAEFGTAEDPFQVPNGMEENLRLLDDHIALTTIMPPVDQGTWIPPGAAKDGDGQIFSNGAYSVLNGGTWRTYSPRVGIRAVLVNQTDGWANTGTAWLQTSVLAAGPVIDIATEAIAPMVDAARTAALDAVHNAGATPYRLESEMRAAQPKPLNTVARVWGDPNPSLNGIYDSNGSTFIRRVPQPATEADLRAVDNTIRTVDARTFGIASRPRSRNILDLTTGAGGWRLQASTGLLTANAAYWTSAYIPVSPMAEYRSSYGSVYALFDLNANFISGGTVASGTNTFQTTVNTAYVRVDYAIASLSSQMLALSSQYPASFDPFVAQTVVERLQYQSDQIATTFEKTGGLPATAASFLRSRTVNLLDVTTNIQGKRVNHVNGTLADYANGSVSQFIRVEPNTTYTRRGSNYYAEYDDEQYFVRGFSTGSPSTFTTAPNTRYLRVSVTDAESATYMLVKGGALPPDFLPYDRALWLSGIEVDRSADRINEARVEFLSRTSPNLMDSRLLTPNKVVNQANGSLMDYPGNSASGYIPVDGDTVYSFTEANFYAEYDENGIFIYGAKLESVFSVTTRPAARFVRMAIRDIVRDRFMFVRGETLPGVYTAFNNWVLTPNIVPGARWVGKKWNVFGDSVIQDALSFWRSVAQQLSFEVARNYGVGGSAYTYRDAPPGVPNPELWTEQYFANRYSSMDDDADLITIQGGNNDFRQVPLGQATDGTNSTFYGALRLLCEGLATKYPDRFVCFMTPFPHRNMRDLDPNGHSWWHFVDAIQEVCGRYSFPVLDVSRNTQLRFYNAASRLAFSRQTTDYPAGDGLHPNAAGHATVVPAVARWILAL